MGLKVKEDEPEQSRKAEALVDFPQSHFMSIFDECGNRKTLEGQKFLGFDVFVCGMNSDVANN